MECGIGVEEMQLPQLARSGKNRTCHCTADQRAFMGSDRNGVLAVFWIGQGCGPESLTPAQECGIVLFTGVRISEGRGSGACRRSVECMGESFR